MEENRNENSRTKNSIFNIGSNFLIFFIKIVLSFVSRTIFIKILGEVYLGVNGLLTNILSMLSLAELGMSAAISFSLYKPIKEKDYDKISSLMSFYKKAYNIIGIIIAVFGIIVSFFLKVIIKNYDQIDNINLIYYLYLINTVSTYFTAYKEILITADQKAYKLTKINAISTVALYTLQSITLLITHSFIAYLIVQFGIQIAQKIATNIYVTKQYPKVEYNSTKKIDNQTMTGIKKNVKGMIYHKVGDYFIYGTDNIIISSFINIQTVGYYSNYTTITTMLNNIITMIFTSMTASFGNLIVTSKEKLFNVFKKVDFMAFVLYSYTGILIIGLANKFIKIWIGEKYLLSTFTVWLIGFNLFFTGMRVITGIIKGAAGENDKDRFVPLIQSLLNIVISIIGAKKWGLDGVIIGTILSSIVPNIVRPIITYKYVFEKEIKGYFIYLIKCIAIFTFSSIIFIIFNKYVVIKNNWLSLLASFVFSIYYLLIVFIFYRNTTEFKESMIEIKDIIRKIRRKNEIQQ